MSKVFEPSTTPKVVVHEKGRGCQATELSATVSSIRFEVACNNEPLRQAEAVATPAQPLFGNVEGRGMLLYTIDGTNGLPSVNVYDKCLAGHPAYAL